MIHIRSFNESVEHKDLLNKQQRLIGELNVLLFQYRELQDYFKGKTPQEAESNFYSEEYWESGYDSEGLFSLHHKTLKERISENREKRKELHSQLDELKKELKNQ